MISGSCTRAFSITARALIFSRIQSRSIGLAVFKMSRSG